MNKKEVNNDSWFAKFSQWLRYSISYKLFLIALLTLLLLVPSLMVIDLINERQNQRHNAIDEVAAKWGAPQIIAGPVISAPYTKREGVQNAIDGAPAMGYVHFLPATLNIKGKLEPVKRKRGIYVVMLYTIELMVEGDFEAPSLENINLNNSEINWSKATLNIGITDLKGVTQPIVVAHDGEATEAEPGLLDKTLLQSGVHVPVKYNELTKKWHFSYKLHINGSEFIKFTPSAKQTFVQLISGWRNPSFIGSFLPKSAKVNTDGFEAEWSVLHLNRNYPQQGVDNFVGAMYTNRYDLESGSGDDWGTFGVKLYLPVDDYQKTYRSAKYAVMFIFLTFLCFFFIEILNDKHIHPVQYLLIGFAVVLFYILLLSISEHLDFDRAYFIASAMIVGLIVAYSWFITHSMRLVAIVAGVFMVLYLFFYSLLQLQDYALLAGSLGLFTILALIMYLTRNFNWYNYGPSKMPNESTANEN